MTKTDTDSSQIRNFFLRVTIELAWVLVNTQHDFSIWGHGFTRKKSSKKGMFVKKEIAEYVCVCVWWCTYACIQVSGGTSGPAWCSCVCVSLRYPIHQIWRCSSEWVGLCTFLQQEHHLNHLFWKDRQQFCPHCYTVCYTVYVYEKELSANLRTGFPFHFWGQGKDSESIGEGYITLFLLCSSFWQISEGHCIEQFSKLDWIGQRDWTREARWSRGVCVREREKSIGEF